jgi:hypothetical protein
VPGVWRGDLFYIQNLAATIEAHDKPHGPDPSKGETR